MLKDASPAETRSTGFTVTAYGAQVGVQVGAPALAAVLKRHLPENVTLLDNARPDAWITVRASTPSPELLEDFDSQLRFALAQYARDRVFIHGGVVSWKGKTAIFPGKSFAGKSHLVAELIRAGAEYFSDDHAMLDEHGLVHPWFKPLALREPASVRQRDVLPSAFGATVARTALPVNLVLSTRFAANSIWNPIRMSPTEGALELMANAIAIRRYPAQVMKAVAVVAAQARVFRTARPDAQSVIPRIFEMLEACA